MDEKETIRGLTEAVERLLPLARWARDNDPAVGRDDHNVMMVDRAERLLAGLHRR
jgi:hypothetical protein